MKLRSGQIIGHNYLILELISSGGFSDVYKACQLSLNRHVAIKVFTAPVYQDLKEMRTISLDEMFDSISRNEIECMLKLKIPQIPQLYDVIDLGTTTAIVMEYFPGSNLMTWIENNGPLPVDKAISFSIQLCKIIEELHRHSIAHCDIKASNMIVDSDFNTVALLDLGLSRIVNDRSKMNVLGRTDGYSSPELYSPKYYDILKKTFTAQKCTSVAYSPVKRNNESISLSRSIIYAADIYSIGATMFYMFTGCHPCYDRTDYQAISDSRLRHIVQACMQEDPAYRYSSVAELRRNLSSLEYEFDVALSYASEDRNYVSVVVEHLKKYNIRIFYDDDQKVKLWGEDIYTSLDDVYRNKARYCVMFISKHYRSKMWTNHERASALDRAFHSSSAYILPAKFDETEIPGIRSTTAYVDLRQTSPHQLAEMIIEKLNYN